MNKSIGDTFSYNIRLDEDPGSDREATFFGDVNDQVARVCDQMRHHPVLGHAPAINAIGFSQGGQFLRAFTQRCNVPPVRYLFTYGSQHNGISEFNHCGDEAWSPTFCRFWNGLLKGQTWSSYVQHHLVPAQYFRNPASLANYRDSSNFLADINNEREIKNTTYAANLASLRRLIMYIFANDTTVVEKQSGHFDEVIRSDDHVQVVKLRDRDLYTQDWLGLKALDEKGALDFRVADGKHMQVTTELLLDAFKMMYGGE